MKMKTRKSKLTVAIGIPAYNEERNIGSLLASILMQRQLSYRLEAVIIVCDGCTDKTAEVAREFTKNNPFIKVIDRKIRTGKADALNAIYRMNKSDFLLTIDADLVFVGETEISKMISVLQKNPQVNVVGPRHIPIEPDSLMGKFAYISFVSFEDAFLQLNNGNNFYAMMAVALMRKQFAKSITFPKGIIGDQCFIYAMATRNNPQGFKLVKEARVFFRTVTTFKDWRILGVRSVIGDKESMVGIFGKEILKEYSMPKDLFIRSLVKWFFKNPFYTLGSILMNMYIRKFPYKKVTPKKGIWEITLSNKEAIAI